jgi:hypothetical protein
MQNFFITETSCLMIFEKIIAIYFENLRKLINTLAGNVKSNLLLK